MLSPLTSVDKGSKSFCDKRQFNFHTFKIVSLYQTLACLKEAIHPCKKPLQGVKSFCSHRSNFFPLGIDSIFKRPHRSLELVPFDKMPENQDTLLKDYSVLLSNILNA